MFQPQIGNVGSSECNPQLYVISVDQHKGIVKVGTKAKDLSTVYAQLQSEDAKSLATRAALQAGMNDPALKHVTIVYGNTKTGDLASPAKLQDTTEDNSYRPFLIVEFHSASLADVQFSGDSF